MSTSEMAFERQKIDALNLIGKQLGGLGQLSISPDAILAIQSLQSSIDRGFKDLFVRLDTINKSIQALKQTK